LHENLVTAIYSPACQANGMFLAKLEEWLAGTRFDLETIRFDHMSPRERAWYSWLGYLEPGGSFNRTVFIDVFHRGRLVDSVPLKKKNLENALGTVLSGEEVCGVEPESHLSARKFLELLSDGEVQAVPIRPDTLRREQSMCLEHHPFGSLPQKYHSACLAMKEPVFEQTFEQEGSAGVFLDSGNGVVGLLEVHPREVLRRNGFVVGRHGRDEDYLTVGCFEVAGGMPRVEVLDRLMMALLEQADTFSRPMLEGIGKLGWSGGFNPYWVYEKYGFCRQGELRRGWVVMEKTIS